MTEGLQKMPSNESLNSNHFDGKRMEKGKLDGGCSSCLHSQGGRTSTKRSLIKHTTYQKQWKMKAER